LVIGEVVQRRITVSLDDNLASRAPGPSALTLAYKRSELHCPLIIHHDEYRLTTYRRLDEFIQP